MNRVLNSMPPEVRAEAEELLKEIRDIPLDTEGQQIVAIDTAIGDFKRVCDRLTALGIATDVPGISQIASISQALAYLLAQGDVQTIRDVGEMVYQARLYYVSQDRSKK